MSKDPTQQPPRPPSATPAGGIPRRTPSASEAQLLARILEVVPGGIVQVGAEGAILRANEQAQRFLGLAWDELSARFIVDFAGESFREDGSLFPVEEYPVTICLATGEPAGPTTLGVRQPSGEVRWAIFTALPFPEPEGDRMGAVVTFVDITERRRAELRARAHDRLLDTVRMVHFRDDPGATVAVFHEPLSSFLEMTGSAMGFIASVDPREDPPEELRIHAIIDGSDWKTGSAAPPAPIDALTREVLESGRPRVVDAPGPIGGAFRRRAPSSVAILPLVTARKVVGVVGLADAPGGYELACVPELEPLLTACADLVAAFDERRARRDLEAQLGQAERLASVGTLAAGMAHEINNPLAYVLLNLQALTRHAEHVTAALGRLEEQLASRVGEVAAREQLDAIGLPDLEKRCERAGQHGKDAIEGAERVQRIVRDLMTFSRVTEEQRTLVDVNAAVDVALKMADHEIKYRARLVREPGQLAPVHGNDGRLSQVFLNLLINAARAIEEGHPEANEIRVRTWMDAGAGLRGDRRHGPRRRGRAHGSPLRALLQHARARRGSGARPVDLPQRREGPRRAHHGGEPGGKRHALRRPPARLRAPARREPRGLEPPPLASEPARPRVLLVDDEPMVLRVLAQLLGRTYEVFSAEGYTSAVAVLERERVDVILCDMMMLDGTGVDVHAWVSEHDPDLAARMIFMTGGTFTPRARAFLAEVPVRHLVKPFSLKELDEVVRTILR
ncbi:MAG: response regulator [Sandaracinaceae bacterium]|nr:response regulator [Sandaracinaceae bacterium]